MICSKTPVQLKLIYDIAAYLQMLGFKVKNIKLPGFPTYFIANNVNITIYINDVDIEVVNFTDRVQHIIPLNIKELNKYIL